MRQAPVTDELNAGYLANVIRVRAESFYADAVELAENAEALRSILGEPIVAELPKGGIRYLREGPLPQRKLSEMLLTMTLQAMGVGNIPLHIEKFAHVSIVLRGPKGRGSLILLAFWEDDEWVFQSLDVAVDGRADRVELMPGKD